MDFGETLLAAQRNQKDKSSSNAYYRTKFEAPKKEPKPASRLSANIQKFLVKKEEEEKRKQDEARRKRDELLAMRDPKATRKIQKMLKVIKSANKAVIEDAIDHENTALTRTGADQPDQDDYGYESQEASALYRKIMDKYSKIPAEEKFPPSKKTYKKDLEGTRERMKAALQREEEPQPRQRKSRTNNSYEKEESPPPQPEKKVDKPKIRKPLPPPIDFNQLLKLAEQKKDEPPSLPVPVKKVIENEPERPMTKKQKKEYEEELARREAKRRRLEADSKQGSMKQDRPRNETEKRPESSIMRIPKIGEKNSSFKIKKINESMKPSSSSETRQIDQKISKHDRSESLSKGDNKTLNSEKLMSNKIPLKSNRDDEKNKSIAKEQYGRNSLIERGQSSKLEEILKMSKQIDKGRSNNERGRIEGSKTQTVVSKSISRDVDKGKFKSEDTKNDYPNRPDTKSKSYKEISKNNTQKVSSGTSDKVLLKQELARRQELKEKMLLKEKKLFGNDNPANKLNGNIRLENKRADDVKSKDVSKHSKSLPGDKKTLSSDNGRSKTPMKTESKAFDFDKHVNSLKTIPEKSNASGSSQRFPPGDVRRKFSSGDPRNNVKGQKRPIVNSDSEYDSEMDDFIDDGDDDANYSAVIKDIFGYDKSKYRDLNDEDDARMESTFAQQMREEYISKKIGIMEDLEDMRMEAMEKKRSKKRRRISDDD